MEGNGNTARYANRKSGEAQTFVCVGSTPTRVIRSEPAVRRKAGSFDGQVVQLVDTRCSERRALRGLGVQISPWSSLFFCRRGRRPTGFHKAGTPGSLPGPAIDVMGRVRKLEKRPGREPGDFVGSTPTSVTATTIADNGHARWQSTERMEGSRIRLAGLRC